MQHDYFSSFNQSNHWFVVLTLPLQSSFLKLPIILRTQRLSVMIRYSDSFASAHQQRQGVLQYLEFQSGCSGFKSRYDHWLVVLSLVYSCFLQAEVLCFAVIHCETSFLFFQIVKADYSDCEPPSKEHYIQCKKRKTLCTFKIQDVMGINKSVS